MTIKVPDQRLKITRPSSPASKVLSPSHLRNLWIDHRASALTLTVSFVARSDRGFAERKRTRGHVAPIVQLIFPVGTVWQSGLSERNAVLTLIPITNVGNEPH